MSSAINSTRSVIKLFKNIIKIQSTVYNVHNKDIDHKIYLKRRVIAPVGKQAALTNGSLLLHIHSNYAQIIN